MTEEELNKLIAQMSEMGFSLDVNSYIIVGLISLISAGIGAYFGSYLKKKGEVKALNEAFEDVKTQLQETTKITESIKDQIGKESYVYRHKFESYHAKQIESIEGLYARLVALEKTSKDFIVSANFSTKDSHGFQPAKDATEEFIAYSSLKQMWIPEELFVEIENLALLIDKHIYSVMLKAGVDKLMDTPSFMGTTSTPEAMDTINNKVPEAKQKIITSVRELLDPNHS